MDLRSLRRRLTANTIAGSTLKPAALLLMIGGGSVVLLVALAARGTHTERVPLAPGEQFTMAEFREAQTTWKAAGLTQARFSAGTIHVPQEESDRYRAAWDGSAAAQSSRSRWADAWQQANDRLSQFSGIRERESARDISRAQTISTLLEALPHIASADIVWDEDEARGWGRTERARATVYLQAEAGRVIGPDVVVAVRRAVSGSKANLDPADVTVMDQSRMIAYDGSQVSPMLTRAAQLVATYRSRLQTALQHIPDATVRVHFDAAMQTAAEQAAPVTVQVTLPEASIRKLAKLDRGAGGSVVGGSESSRAREVFQAVEQHLHTSIRSKVAALIPTGLTLANAPQTVVETIPTPVAETPPAAGARRTALLSAWLQQHSLPVVAVLFGFAALWTLRPRRRTPPPASVERYESSNVATAQPIANESESLRKESTPHEDAHSDPPVPESAAASTEPPVDSPAFKAPHETEEWSGTPQQQRPSAPADNADLLRDVLARLDHRQQRTSTTEHAGSQRSDFSPTPTVVAGRLPATTTPAVPTDIDLESLTQEPPHRLAEIVRRVDIDVWSRAMFGASAALQDSVTPHLAPADVVALTKHLSTGRPVRLRDIDAARETVRSVWANVRQELPTGHDSPVPTAHESAAA